MSFVQDCTFFSYIRALIDQSEQKLVSESYIDWVIDHGENSTTKRIAEAFTTKH